MSKVGDLTALIEGSHVLGENGLRDYHAAAAAVNGLRKRDFLERFNTVKTALKNHRVIVSYDGQSMIRVFRPDTDKKLFFAPKTP